MKEFEFLFFFYVPAKHLCGRDEKDSAHIVCSSFLSGSL